MMTKCDYCRRPLGLNVHRYWRMQFCSPDCIKAYKDRLDKVTIGKVRCLEIELNDIAAKVRKEAA
jgi:hypothetical protein